MPITTPQGAVAALADASAALTRTLIPTLVAQASPELIHALLEQMRALIEAVEEDQTPGESSETKLPKIDACHKARGVLVEVEDFLKALEGRSNG